MSKTFDEWFEKFNYSTYGEYCKSDLKSAYKAGQKDKEKAAEKRVIDEIQNIMININSDSLDFNKLYNIMRKKYGVMDEKDK